jgi:hypothetical protein
MRLPFYWATWAVMIATDLRVSYSSTDCEQVSAELFPHETDEEWMIGRQHRCKVLRHQQKIRALIILSHPNLSTSISEKEKSVAT